MTVCKSSYKKLEELVLKQKITFYRLSKETGLSTTLFSEWKRGKSKPKFNKLLILAKHFNVPVEYFVDDKKEST